MSQSDSPQSRESRPTIRDQLGLKYKKNLKKPKNFKVNEKNYFLAEVTRPPYPSNSWKFHADWARHKARHKLQHLPVVSILGYQSLARFACSALIMSNWRNFVSVTPFLSIPVYESGSAWKATRFCCAAALPSPSCASNAIPVSEIYTTEYTGNKLTSWRWLRVFLAATAWKSTQPPPGG